MLIKNKEINHRLSQIIPDVDIDVLRAIPAINDAIAEYHNANDTDSGHRAFQKITLAAECVAAGIKIAKNN